MRSMFRDAIKIARHYTAPVILSRKDVGGLCDGQVAAFVVINSDGWIVTADHIVRELNDLHKTRKRNKEKEKAGNPLKNDDLSNFSAWWSFDGVRLREPHGIPTVDLAVGRLEPFDPSWAGPYPVFKDPDRDFDVGTSLCRLGYPFSEVDVSWDDEKHGFDLAGTLPVPLFPIEGIYTRTVEFFREDGEDTPYPYMMIETSSPGLKGQSGGPIFDNMGCIWGIQSCTVSYPLHFETRMPQFLNVGRGAHSETILNFFDEVGIRYEKSPY